MMLGYEIIKFNKESPKYHLFNNSNIWKLSESLCEEYVLGREFHCDDNNFLDILDCKNV